MIFRAELFRGFVFQGELSKVVFSFAPGVP